ncbi:MAG: 2-phospho-L-lactate transferase [Terriglobales bacterium]|jgi:LPPG:FO 2-phospho-L-lactate transferase
MITVLAGGTGGAKFVQGVMRILPPEELTVIVNTGDDLTWWGLHVSPDLDSITYALAGILSRERGWGIEGDTFTCLERMRQLGAPAWFQLGDRDLATHLRRTQLLTVHTLTEATSEIASEMGIRARILPMSDDRVETRVLTAAGELSFQEYFVRERYRVPAKGVRLVGAEQARAAPGVVEAIRDAAAVLIAPSNPITSIGPILSVPGIRAALCQTAVIAVSPIVGGAAVSGPAGELMKTQQLPVSIAGVAQAYEDFLDALIADERDRPHAAEVEKLGMHVTFTNTIMDSDEAKAELARAAVSAIIPARAAPGSPARAARDGVVAGRAR